MDPDDWAIFMDPEDFAAAFRWDSESAGVDAFGIFSASHQIALGGEMAGISTVAPVLVVAVAHLPADHAQGDAVEVMAGPHGKGGRYAVADIQPDGAGMARVQLERMA